MSLHHLRYRAAMRLRLNTRGIVFIEGGLGTQILGMMVYRIRHAADPRTRCDVSYFAAGLEAPRDTDGPTLRPWELGRYGYPLSDFPSSPRPRYLIRLNPEDQAALDVPVFREISASDWRGSFPLVPETSTLLSALDLAVGTPFAAVHIRRGDYLKVASRVVALSETLDILERVEPLIPDRLVVLSDEPLLQDEERALRASVKGRRCDFLAGDDPHASHGLMRSSNLLITSNSTFSWTAALLLANERATAIAPQHFFGAQSPALNRVFQTSSDWMLVRPMGQGLHDSR